MLTRLNLLLLAVLVLSGLALVRSNHEMRQLVAQIHQAKSELLRLEGEHARLEAERQAQGTAKTVERVARERLSMRGIAPSITYYEGQGAPTLAAAAPARTPIAAPARGPIAAPAPGPIAAPVHPAAAAGVNPAARTASTGASR